MVWSSLLISFFYWLLSDIRLWSDHRCCYPFSIGYCLTSDCGLIIAVGIFSISYCLTSDCGLIIPVDILFLLVIAWHLIVVWSSGSFFHWLLPDIWLWSDHPCWYPCSIGYCLTSDCGLIIPVGILFSSPGPNEWSLECPLPSFCFLCRSEIQDGHHRRT